MNMKYLFTFLVLIFCFFVSARDYKNQHRKQTKSNLTISQEKNELDSIPTILSSKKWKVFGNFAINLTQSNFTNWSTGGDDAFAGLSKFNLNAEYKKNKVLWINTFDLQYGINNTSENDLRKSIDEIKLNSKYQNMLREKLYSTFLLDIKSQLTKGYNYPNDSVKISDFFAPGYVNISYGLEYKFNDNFNVYVSPVSGKFTFVLDDYLSNLGYFGVKEGKKIKSELGFLFIADFKKEIMKNVNLKTNFEMFSSYTNNFGNIDFLWDLGIDMKVNKYISANINTGLIYDDDIDYIDENGLNNGPKIQLKEIISVGFSYNFGHKK